uniref:DnaJ heat shock protein family (Hsp40) member C24 n=1 Tax=Oryzias melastigma TaxID=30732 RepID=A0A3B3DVX6_ORYME
MCAAAQTDLYAVLGAHPSDSVQQLRRRYQQLALQFHPDRVGGEHSSTAESAVSRFLEVDAAWKILSDQNTRRQYDSQRRAEALTQDCPVDSTVHLEDMNFDLDLIIRTLSSSSVSGGVRVNTLQQREGPRKFSHCKTKSSQLCLSIFSLNKCFTLEIR